ncbi:family 20 glycosylhydrolase [Sphingobacterium sp. SYP-B4668]|uniref:family 20 glycosylhydrolase n=1 Tax=Sphingobacterium sp. SYP-B4668 TaxID=2996035 RepID=UPI0022DDB225|nr:family 20 glycosylhydrolase [Sphingobacterium sp. SYP-B4668]
MHLLKYLSYIFLLGFSTVGYAQSIPALIPLPQEVQWGQEKIDLKNGVRIVSLQPTLQHEVNVLVTILQSQMLPISSLPHQQSSEITFTLQLDSLDEYYTTEGAYRLKVQGAAIHLTAGSAVGIYYGLQTFRQLFDSVSSIQSCMISDSPAYAWRGYLVDVGRNYQSLETLKEQIDVMASYKMNIFHFHFTEDIAWRLVSKQYPGLTEASNMLRWAGKYYSEADFKSLIAYCAERHITLVPEIDMPGHSGAFRRYFNVDMQSPQGMTYVKELVREFVMTYPELSYLHIGGDEVKITNQQFLPEMTTFIDSLGKQTLGWEPGGNLSSHTIRQLWMGGPKPITTDSVQQFIDSKHLYINHMDPLETVTTLFHRRIGEQSRGNINLLGGILCAWPDRAVANERDVFTQNAVYPGLLTFAERSWHGGGLAGWVCNMYPASHPAGQEFRAFEERLLAHKRLYFQHLPFPYTRQAGLQWNFYGPYVNEGHLQRVFEPELIGSDLNSLKANFVADGGTLILRHWWANIIKGTIPNPEPNTTWYASTRIWSDREEVRPFWIGFDNLSRSYASDSPVLGQWDNRSSQVWVNRQLIVPPTWQRAGAKGDLEIPLVDEGYSYRSPTQIILKKGWNEVLLKLPVARFEGMDWQNPVKWMFTFVPL